MSSANTPTRLHRIAIVSPYPWSDSHPVNEHIEALADGLTKLRIEDDSVPQIVVIAPHQSLQLRRAARSAIRQLARGADDVTVLAARALQAPQAGSRRSAQPAHKWPLLAMPMAIGTATVGVRSALQILFDRADISMVNVHDPLASDLARHCARRFSGLTVATVHETIEATDLKGVAGAVRARVLDQVDHWIVDSEAAVDQVKALFDSPPDHVSISALVPQLDASSDGKDRGERNVIILRAPGDEALIRQTLRSAVKDSLLDHGRTIFLARWEAYHRPTIHRKIRARVAHEVARTQADAANYFDAASIVIAPPNSDHRSVLQAQASGCTVVHVSNVREIAQAVTPGAGAGAPQLGGQLPTATQMAQGALQVMRSAVSQVQVHIPAPQRDDRSCLIDLHMHTNHSWDCATDPEALLYVAKQVGLTALAVTDHNEISGALACAEVADEYGIQVIVGEEVKTSEGEVIGLFLSERIEAGLTWVETIAEIRRQDGLVYVPHPFDRLHTIPDVNTLRATLDDIDAFEVYNARLPFEQYNRDAEKFARKYNLIEGAGSDSHVVQGLGTAAVHMPAWDDPESFLTSLRQGEILRRPKNLLYLQGLKWVNDLTGRSKVTPPEAVGKAKK